jgi:RNase P/RNase MRP subunit POP5
VIKIKGLLPSLREQNRYVLFEVMSGKQHEYIDVASAVLQECKSYFGVVGFAKAGPMIIRNKWDSEKQTGILKVDRKYVDWAKAAFIMIKSIKENPVIVRSKTVSGILKKAC